MEQNTKQFRELTKEIRIGDRVIGGSYPILIQSMTNTKTQDIDATFEQILRLEEAGCEIIRCTVPDMEAAKAIGEIKKRIHIPLVADIHFDYRLAIAAMENGADKIRINPGNIGSDERVRAVVEKAKEYHVPIRVGVNSGSLEKKYIEKYNIKDVVIGSIFTNYISEETVHFSNKNELFYTKNSDEDMIISELSKITNVYKRSSEVMYKYNVSNHIEKVKNEVAKLLEGDNSGHGL